MIKDTSFVPKKADGCLRLVTNNVLQQAINKSEQRLLDLIEAFKVYDADFFALQEVDIPWREERHISEELEKIGYSLAPSTDRVHTPIYYKTDRYTLVDCGFSGYNLKGLAEQSVRAYSFACVEHKESGKKLILTNTHLISHGKGMSEEAQANRELHRQQCARQFPEILQTLSNKFGGAPTLSTGDFNSYCDSLPYQILAGALNSAREVCPSRVNMEYMTSCLLGVAPTIEKDKAIDHVFYSKSGITAKHFESVIHPYTYAYSDHVPVFFDFYLD